MNPATVSIAAGIDETATVPSREWWRREAAREGSDWLTILSEYLALVGHLAGGRPAIPAAASLASINRSALRAVWLTLKRLGRYRGSLPTAGRHRPLSKPSCTACGSVG
jgi:hypothetical protein